LAITRVKVAISVLKEAGKHEILKDNAITTEKIMHQNSLP